MPELVEVERYRRLAEQVVGRRVSDVEVLDPRVLRGVLPAVELRQALLGRPVVAARRRGKLLLLDMGALRPGNEGVGPGEGAAAASGTGAGPGSGPTLGLRFGMTGSLEVDGKAAIDRLLHSPPTRDRGWVRFRIRFAGRLAPSELLLHDPRRLGRVELDPDEDALGPDAATATLGQLRRAVGGRGGGSVVPLKAKLLDQGHLAGVGNLMADEVLWRAGLSPRRRAGSLTEAELRRLHHHLRRTVADLMARGGSNTGTLMPERHPGGRCPRDGTALVRSVVGGRTTWWCPTHQL